MVRKGYSDHEKIRDCDDLYDATEEEQDRSGELLDELLRVGASAFETKYGLNNGRG